jgi:hypothetical protein
MGTTPIRKDKPALVSAAAAKSIIDAAAQFLFLPGMVVDINRLAFRNVNGHSVELDRVRTFSELIDLDEGTIILLCHGDRVGVILRLGDYRIGFADAGNECRFYFCRFATPQGTHKDDLPLIVDMFDSPLHQIFRVQSTRAAQLSFGWRTEPGVEDQILRIGCRSLGIRTTDVGAQQKLADALRQRGFIHNCQLLGVDPGCENARERLHEELLRAQRHEIAYDATLKRCIEIPALYTPIGD